MSTVIDTLICNRTQADVDRVFELKKKILQHGLESLSVAEKNEYMTGMKGAYNYTDLNRVGSAIKYLTNRLNSAITEIAEYRNAKGVAKDALVSLPYEDTGIRTSPKVDWTYADIPTSQQANKYILDLQTVRNALGAHAEIPQIPDTLNSLTFEGANAFESMLKAVDAMLTSVITRIKFNIDMANAAFMYANTYYCGDD